MSVLRALKVGVIMRTRRPALISIDGRRSRMVLRCCVGALILVALVMLTASLALATTPSFPDVSTNHKYYTAISDLAARGIIGGKTDGKFWPDESVTRQQFAKMAVLTGEYPVSESDVCTFSDVDKGDASTLFPDNYIAVCAAMGITQGKTSTTFDPYSYITRLQVASMVVRMANNLQQGLLADPPTGWAGNDNWASDLTHGANAKLAEYNGLLAGLDLASLSPSGNMTRGEVAQVLYNLLGKLGTGPTTTAEATTTTLGPVGYENLGGTCAPGSSPAAASWGPGRLDLFIRGADDTLWHRAYEDTWGEWESLGGVLTSDPAAVSWGTNRIDVFARGLDNHLIHIAWTGAAWSPWQDLGRDLSSSPAVCSPKANMLGVAWRNASGAVTLLGYNSGNWFPWISIAGTGDSAPACVSTGMTDSELFFTGSDSKLYYAHYNGATWSTLQVLGGDCASGPGASSWGANRLDVFVRGPLNDLWQKSYSGSWSAWTALEGSIQFQGDPDAVCWGPNRIDLFAVGSDLAVWHKYWDDNQWKP